MRLELNYNRVSHNNNNKVCLAPVIKQLYAPDSCL